MENRLKYSLKDLETSKKSITQYDYKLAEFESELEQVGVNTFPFNLLLFVFVKITVHVFQPKIGKIERKMFERNQTIQEIKQKMNNVEDYVYADFCKKIGVANIRQYEELELVLQQERAKIRADFDQKIDRIASRLDFERTKDTTSDFILFRCHSGFNFLLKQYISVNVQRWERSVQDEEDLLERCKQAETKHKQEIEVDKQKIEQMKQEKQEKKKVVDQMEEETAKVEHDFYQ